MIISTFKSHRFLSLALFASLPAIAQDAAPAVATSPMEGLLVNLPFLLAIFALFYFALIRPQKQQQKQHLEFVSSLGKGDEIVTSSGIIGKITGLTDKVATLEIAPGTEIKVLRAQIQHKWSQFVAAQTATSDKK
jgi:preprotein translocase subunit YajC